MNSSPPEAVSDPEPSNATDDEVPKHVKHEWETAERGRNQIRAEIRARMRYRLFTITGILDPVGMRWTDKLFLKVIVALYCCRLEGWPPDIPFEQLSRRNTETLTLLLNLWKSGTLRIVKLTDDERAQAAADPSRFLPNTTIRLPSPPPSPENAVRVVPIVLHPVDFHDLSQRPADDAADSTTSGMLTTVARPKKRKRKQRCDTKLARKRPLRYGRGVKTAEYVYDTDDLESICEPGLAAQPFREALSDDYIEEFSDVAVEAEDEEESESESRIMGGRSDGDNNDEDSERVVQQ